MSILRDKRSQLVAKEQLEQPPGSHERRKHLASGASVTSRAVVSMASYRGVFRSLQKMNGSNWKMGQIRILEFM